MWKKAAFALLTTVLFLAVTEGVARVVKDEVSMATIPADQVKNHAESAGMRYHPELGWVRRFLPDPTHVLNAEGFRYDRDVDKDKPDDRFRAFTLGDSQTYGAGLDWNQTYTYVAEQELRSRHGGDIEVINTGISGYGSLQALRLIRLQLLDYDPDLIIIDCRTRDALRDDGVRSVSAGPIHELLFYSRAYYFLRVGIERARGTHGRPAHAEAMADDWRPGDGGAGNHDLIQALGEREGFDVLFVDYPIWQTPGQRIVSLVREDELPEGAQIARLTKALQDTGRPGSELFFDANHMKAEGAQVAGIALADAIDEGGWISR